MILMKTMTILLKTKYSNINTDKMLMVLIPMAEDRKELEIVCLKEQEPEIQFWNKILSIYSKLMLVINH
jgi:hypothetical protein